LLFLGETVGNIGGKKFTQYGATLSADLLYFNTRLENLYTPAKRGNLKNTDAAQAFLAKTLYIP